MANSKSLGEASPPMPMLDQKYWAHFVAGGVGGMVAATLTAPLDVLKTRLQSDFYKHVRQPAGNVMPISSSNPFRAGMRHLSETFQILYAVYKVEGPRALFKGLGPNLVGVIPARSINFWAYGNSKAFLSHQLDGTINAPWIHVLAGVIAGVTTSTATNPIWLVKTRLQLDKESVSVGKKNARRYKNSLDCVVQVLRSEGIPGLYRGLSASYLGVGESTLQWVLYEQAKKMLQKRKLHMDQTGKARTLFDQTIDWTGNMLAAGSAKLVAALVAYPHEVIRTRLRQAPLANGTVKYTGLVQCCKIIWKEEGLAGMYGGMTPHLLRTVPSAAIMFGVYEGLMAAFGAKS